ncbi:MAG: hypothetical protein KA508_06360 [Gammaproteobacteria bacterium]|nr:hypothetical protein [Gammaproteobacteria bacterium]
MHYLMILSVYGALGTIILASALMRIRDAMGAPSEIKNLKKEKGCYFSILGA